MSPALWSPAVGGMPSVSKTESAITSTSTFALRVSVRVRVSGRVSGRVATNGVRCVYALSALGCGVPSLRVYGYSMPSLCRLA